MLNVVLEQIRRARSMTWPPTCAWSDMVRHCFFLRPGQSETVEGIRALAVDKDHHAPKWSPARIEDVTPIWWRRFCESLASARASAGVAGLIAGMAAGVAALRPWCTAATAATADTPPWPVPAARCASAGRSAHSQTQRRSSKSREPAFLRELKGRGRRRRLCWQRRRGLAVLRQLSQQVRAPKYSVMRWPVPFWYMNWARAPSSPGSNLPPTSS